MLELEVVPYYREPLIYTENFQAIKEYIKVYIIWYKTTLFIFNRCGIIFVFQHVCEKLNIDSLDMTTFAWVPGIPCNNLSYY